MASRPPSGDHAATNLNKHERTSELFAREGGLVNFVTMTSRLLFVDDSGKPENSHASRAVVLGGFAIDAEDYPTLSRRVLGAKGKYFPQRGQPQTWKIKSSNYVKPNPWKRARNRSFCFELARILGTVGATVFTATLDKSQLNHRMSLQTSMPLQLQCLIEHFDVECRSSETMGLVVSDWSNHHLDGHASQCVASFAASMKLRVHPAVYYASSHAHEGVQVADLIAAVKRRCAEGDGNLVELCSALHAHSRTNGGQTAKQRAFANEIALF